MKSAKEKALATIFAYHHNPNYGDIPDDEIDWATLFLAKYVKALTETIPFVLIGHSFHKVERKDRKLYGEWCMKIEKIVDEVCEDTATREV